MQPVIETIHIKELNLEMLPPNKSNYKDPEQGGLKLIVCGKPGCFKAGTRVMLSNGRTKNVEDIKIGDQLMGPDSKPRNVLELRRGRQELFRVIPKYGESYTVNRGHDMVITLDGEVREVSVHDCLTIPEYIQKPWKIFRAEVDFPEVPSDENPYQAGCNVGNVIRDVFLYNSRDIRRTFLAGILDTKGVIRSADSKVFVASDSESFREQLAFLCRTLGLIADITPSWTQGGVYIYGTLTYIPTFRKFLDFSEDVSQCCFGFISEGLGNYYGFTLDQDNRFLLGTCDVVKNTGKTTLISSLLYAKKHVFPVAMVMSGTEDSNHFYRSVLPSSFVFNSYDEAQVEKFIKRQKLAKIHVENPWAILILDDCTDEPKLFRKGLQQGMYKRGRHWKMWYILSLQYGMDVLPVIRTNVDGVFILREPNLRNRKVMYENYGGIIPDFSLFCSILDQITDDYTALYIHNATKTNDWKECVFWYKAKPIPKDFKFGCPTFWDHHYQRYNPEYIDPITV